MKPLLPVVLMFTLAVVAGCNREHHKPPAEGSVMCTQEAKMCPDGSYVGRTGPHCEFAACPK